MNLVIEFALGKLEPSIPMVKIKDFISFRADIVAEFIKNAWIGQMIMGRKISSIYRSCKPCTIE